MKCSFSLHSIVFNMCEAMCYFPLCSDVNSVTNVRRIGQALGGLSASVATILTFGS